MAKPDIAAVVAYGAILGTMNALFYQAFARIPVGVAVAIEVTGPLTIALLRSRRLSDIVWLVMASTGLALLSPLGVTPMQASIGLDPVGVAFALGAALCWALYIVFGKRVSATVGGDAVAWGMMVAAVLIVPAGIFVAGPALFSAPVLIGGLGVAVLSSALPYSLEMEALRRVPAHVFGLMVSAAPAVATLAGFVILGERIGPTQWVAITFITAASGGSAIFAGANSGNAANFRSDSKRGSPRR